MIKTFFKRLWRHIFGPPMIPKILRDLFVDGMDVDGDFIDVASVRPHIGMVRKRYYVDILNDMYKECSVPKDTPSIELAPFLRVENTPDGKTIYSIRFEKQIVLDLSVFKNPIDESEIRHTIMQEMINDLSERMANI